MAADARRKERIEARLQPEKKARIQRAADLEGVSLSDFVVSKAYAAAEEVIRAHEVLELTERDSVRFVEALLNPPEPNEHLRAAFDHYRATFHR
jgi:uncharacterized protein (DUF1778 family)